MKFGIFYELQLPRPWGPDSELTLYHNALDQLELADRLGYDFAWEVEHHFLEEYSHSPAPEVFLAAASQRTRQIRLAHGIMQLTTVHPARVAERIAALDLVSRGRVEFGMGESASITELEPFDRSFDEKRAVWEDAVRAVIPMFKDGGCEYHGDLFRFPAAQCRAQAVAEAASAVMGCVLGARHDRDGRAPRPRRARLPVPERRCGACLGPRLLQFLHQAARQADGLRDQPEYRSDQLFHVRRDRRGSAPPRRRHPVLPVRAALLRAEPQPQTAGARHGRSVGRVREVEARQPRGSRPRTVRRPDRLTRDACAASCGGSRARISTRSSC